MSTSFVAVTGIPEVEKGADLAALIGDALAAAPADPGATAGAGETAFVDMTAGVDARSPGPPRDGDVLVVAQKIVSKAEGRARPLASIEVGARARELAERTGKDPRLVQAILDESVEVVRARPGVLIVRTRHGFVCANAGIDRSNVPGDDLLLRLPVDPDASARSLRRALCRRFGVTLAVVVSDSFGRAWRVGQLDVAIGCAGLKPVEDLRGETDANGRELSATVRPVADELAAGANLARAKQSGTPVVLVRGAAGWVTTEDGPGAAPLLRERSQDLFN